MPKLPITQDDLDEVLSRIHRYFLEGDETAGNLNDPDTKEVIAILAQRGLLYCRVFRVVAGSLKIRWLDEARITPSGLARLKEVGKI